MDIHAQHFYYMRGVFGALKSASVTTREALLLPVLRKAPGGARVGATLPDTLLPYAAILKEVGMDFYLRDVPATELHASCRRT